MTTVSVIILNYNGRSSLGPILDACIKSVLNQERDNFELKIIFADNGSKDDSAEYVSSNYPEVKVIRFPRNLGFCRGNNLAVKFAKDSSNFYLFLNPDAILRKDYIKEVLRAFKGNRKLGIAQGLEIVPNLRIIRIGLIYDSTLRSILLYAPLQKYRELSQLGFIPVDACIGAAMCIRSRLFRAVGGFPEEYFMYYDELDLALKCRALGFMAATITTTHYIHYIGGLTKIKALPCYFMWRNRLLIALKYLSLKDLLKALVQNLLVELPFRLYSDIVTGNTMEARMRIEAYKNLVRRLRTCVLTRKRHCFFRKSIASEISKRGLTLKSRIDISAIRILACK